MSASELEPASFLPLPNLAYHVLLSLTAGPMHGYAIAKETERRTDGRTRPSTGSLYLALTRLEEQGLVEESPEPPPDEPADGRRRYYRITEAGERVARAESERLAGLVRLATERRLLDGVFGAGPDAVDAEAGAGG